MRLPLGWLPLAAPLWWRPVPVLSIPWKRRLETLAVVHHVFCWIVLPVFSCWLPIYLLFWTRWWWAMVAYIGWHALNWDAPRRGSRPQEWYRSHTVWRHFADYFPIRLVKTAELDPERNYIVGSHPHGILSIGCFTNFLTNATGFKDIFPGFTSTLLTLSGQFWFPFRRDIGLALGGVESSHASLKYLLTRREKGQMVAIVVGGAQEALNSAPGYHGVNLKARRGFCRYAIKYNADLLPMWNFGENEVYELTAASSVEGSPMRKVQTLIKSKFGFCPPLFLGRGVLNYGFGILPHRRAITSVVGAPVRVDPPANGEEPSEDEVDQLHERYCRALVELFEREKAKYGVPAEAHIHFY